MIQTPGQTAITWAHPTADLWVGSCATSKSGADYVGFIERLENGFHANSYAGHPLGVFADREQAQHIVAVHHRAGIPALP